MARLDLLVPTLAALSVLVLAGCGHDAQQALSLEGRYQTLRLMQFAEVPDITPNQVQVWRAAGRPLVLVDVREPRERQVSTLPGAISQEEFEADPQRYRSSLVVPYCTIGLRSGLYGQQLQQQGFQVRNLAGSALAWAHADLLFEHQGQPTRRLHVYSPDWNMLPRGYEAVADR